MSRTYPKLGDLSTACNDQLSFLVTNVLRTITPTTDFGKLYGCLGCWLPPYWDTLASLVRNLGSAEPTHRHVWVCLACAKGTRHLTWTLYRYRQWHLLNIAGGIGAQVGLFVAIGYRSVISTTVSDAFKPIIIISLTVGA